MLFLFFGEGRVCVCDESFSGKFGLVTQENVLFYFIFYYYFSKIWNEKCQKIDNCPIGQAEDECGVCGGSGIPDGDCDCEGNVFDLCDGCGGNNSCLGRLNPNICPVITIIRFSVT